MDRGIEYSTYIYTLGDKGSLNTTKVVVGVGQRLVPNEELLEKVRRWPGYDDPYMRKELKVFVQMVVER